MLLAVLAATIAGPAEPAPDQLHVFRSSREEMTRYAMAKVCLPMLQDRADLATAVGKNGFRWRLVPDAYALAGAGPNYVKLDARGGCYFRMERGDAPKLREAVLSGLRAAGAAPLADKAFDAGPDSRDSRGKLYRQESYCLDARAADGTPLGVVISSGEGPGPVLQVSLVRDDGRCAAAP
jgi:hypothetical protein